MSQHFFFTRKQLLSSTQSYEDLWYNQTQRNTGWRIKFWNRDTKDSTINSILTLVLLNFFNCIFRHLKLELLTQFPASNDKKYYYLDIWTCLKLYYLINKASIKNYFIKIKWYLYWSFTSLTPYISGHSRTRVKYNITPVYSTWGIWSTLVVTRWQRSDSTLCGTSSQLTQIITQCWVTVGPPVYNAGPLASQHWWKWRVYLACKTAIIVCWPSKSLLCFCHDTKPVWWRTV